MHLLGLLQNFRFVPLTFKGEPVVRGGNFARRVDYSGFELHSHLDKLSVELFSSRTKHDWTNQHPLRGLRGGSYSQGSSIHLFSITAYPTLQPTLEPTPAVLGRNSWGWHHEQVTSSSQGFSLLLTGCGQSLHPTRCTAAHHRAVTCLKCCFLD